MKRTMNPHEFRGAVWNHYASHKRNFPWRETRNPYHILVSEIMLQQTQTSRVAQKYETFLKTFPTIHSLARAPISKVLRAWQGLGYNRRALALARTAEIIEKNYSHKVPADSEILSTLPGIGKATAGAIAAFAYNAPTVFIETNIRRSFLYFFFKGRKNVSDKTLIPLVEAALDRKNPREWYYALMDYGAMLGKLAPNANRRSRHYKTQSPFAGSLRKLRGAIIKTLLTTPKVKTAALASQLKEPMPRVKLALAHLKREGFVDIEKGATVKLK